MKIKSALHTYIAISFIPKLNTNLALPFIERCGGIEAFFRESQQALSALCTECNINPQTIDRQEALQQADLELEKINKYNIKICTIESDLYPALLKQCEDVPLTLFYKGNIKTFIQKKYLAIVGTRKASEFYKAMVKKVIEDFHCLQDNITIVSGLAYGIDAAAHRASLEYGIQTFAVLGHGLHMVYPATNNSLANSILEHDGALISEFPCISKIYPNNFLRRNRIIAGLCQATLIAESAIKGGAMSTARTALSYNRDVMTFPGRPNETYSAGCNKLIKENVAALVENAEDIANILNVALENKRPIQTSLNLFGNEDKSKIILACLKRKEEKSIDEISLTCGIPVRELSALLLQMELEGTIISLPGKRYISK